MRLIDADYVLKCIPQEEINARFAVANAPTVEAEPVRHGHWKNRLNIKTCSVCGRERESRDSWWSYCPNCGAKMDEVI